ncbi:PepSY domain-containing protein [Pseudoduganella umbonata]|uniref:Nitric oxide synthase n=1 Tax=Pseudoduganella umbonata TaxID=864828 RepID=A0A4P8HP20_9BURK|nr:sulfite reductase flavoprotein subunit alpha [Pseudoduganella umbonata]MBB3220217.1 sulfite reductase (NADPH) flavoprotein alpha-component [Pseudoduganella umbonata]QCP10198.1 nitric oxide synthase [Pseudoduganella umbonata]
MKRDSLPAGATPAAPLHRPLRRLVLPTWKQVWFQLHWFIGITAGTVLVVIGLSGALLVFKEEMLDLANPGVRHVPVQNAPVLAPQQVAQAVRAAHPERRVTSVIVYSAPGAAARAGLAALPGQPRGESVYVHPYAGTIQPELVGEAAFEWIEFLHRWLLLERETGKPVTGTLALCLLGLALSGLYLRWPRNAGNWRTWLTVDTRLRGRSFLWALHAVAGTWALLAYMVFTLTGAYWAFDAVRDTVDGWAGVKRPPREAPAKPAARTPGQKRDRPAPVDLAPAWNTFTANAPGWQMAFLRFTDKPNAPVQVAWLAADAPHPRARSAMTIAPDGTLAKNEPYAAKSAGARALTTIYPLHIGTYFGLPGQVAMMLASLALPGFAVTGWMLYLKRRRQARAARAERARLQAIDGAAHPPAASALEPVLVAYASQTGQAERLALRTAAALRASGTPADVRAVATLTPADLAGYRDALFVASSYGEGEPPDGARRFARQLAGRDVRLPALQYAVLALGDSAYPQFCGFGRALDGRLAELGGTRLFAPVEVDNGDEAAVARWSSALACLGAAPLAAAPANAGEPWQAWTLAQRTLLNPGSLGAPLYEVRLAAHGQAPAPAWLPGALVEIQVRHADAVVQAWLAQAGLDGRAVVGRDTLAALLAASELPDAGHRFASAGACAAVLKPLAPRRYSVASLPSDGAVELLVRQVRHEQGLGLASGWLTAHAAPGTALRARLLENPGFAPVDADVPCIFIGNGSGLAGLRGHLRARVAAGRQRNWLLFGERQRAFDGICAAELGGWAAGGFLPELDLVYSRDGEGYVQDRLRARAAVLRAWIADGAAVYVCGSLQGMAGGVDAALADLLGHDTVELLAAEGRIRRDVY